MIDTVALLLAERAPALRRRALLELDGAGPQDPEVAALAAEIPASREVASALAAPVESTMQLSFTLCRLAYLGLGRGHPAVEERGERLFSLQRQDGSWPFDRGWGGAPRVRGKVPPNEGYEWRPLQTALPLRGLAAAGFATDPRAERAYGWLLDHRMEDGSWPYGKAAGQRPGAVVGYRRLPRSEGCRNTTTGALACLAHHPDRRVSAEARTALDLLLQRETREEATLGHEVARLLGAVPPRGFATFYARFDLAFILDLASRMGASPDDPRVADLIAFLESRRGEHGLWEHPSHPHLSRWLTLDLLASRRRMEEGDWTGSDLRSSFRPYPRGRRRY